MAKTVLVVDDEIGLCKMISKVLRAAEIGCVIAYSGEEALEAYRASRPDLILLDIAMPGITGWDVAREIRADEAAKNLERLPIVIMSAHSRLFDLAEQFNLSIDSFLAKPLDLTQVLTLVTDLLRGQPAA